jgi:ribulose-phosphate 3-epimerase
MASILDADYSCLRSEIERVDKAGVDAFTLDIMDGRFVERFTFGDQLAAKIREWTSLPIEVHLMVSEPAGWARRFCDAGADMILFHLEATSNPMEVIDVVRSEGRSVGIALLSETPVSALDLRLLESVDTINFLAVPVGFGGAPPANNTLDRIQELRARCDEEGVDVAIEVDGGVKPNNACEFAQVGTDLLTVGTGIYHADDLASAMRELRACADTGDVDGARRRLDLFLSRPSRQPRNDPERRERLEEIRSALDIPAQSWDPKNAPLN